jgi:hypothetical protein
VAFSFGSLLNLDDRWQRNRGLAIKVILREEEKEWMAYAVKFEVYM